ncbi:hypothetical protein FN846DRAFT_894936 [Sphaerosporella brunnea]|uniref:Uncharacterized protein n=1 Tax=Sphaerosporella brunnea TaxID=1250544 RepID=A0A5J5EI45_9PEZI|nr:hypothetical protein FN846DRAFT_894936 [Sphaerosporella brunnea]
MSPRGGYGPLVGVDKVSPGYFHRRSSGGKAAAVVAQPSKGMTLLWMRRDAAGLRSCGAGSQEQTASAGGAGAEYESGSVGKALGDGGSGKEVWMPRITATFDPLPSLSIAKRPPVRPSVSDSLKVREQLPRVNVRCDKMKRVLLKEHNYLEWEENIRDELLPRGLWGIMEGTTEPPLKPTAPVATGDVKGKKEDAVAVLSAKQPQSRPMLSSTSRKSAWRQRKYGGLGITLFEGGHREDCNRVAKIDANDGLYKLNAIHRIDFNSATACHCRILKIATELRNTGAELPESVQAFYMIQDYLQVISGSLSGQVPRRVRVLASARTS